MESIFAINWKRKRLVRQIDDSARFVKKTVMKKNTRIKKMEGREKYGIKKPMKKRRWEKPDEAWLGNLQQKQQSTKTKKKQKLYVYIN